MPVFPSVTRLLIFLLVLTSCQSRQQTLFERQDADQTGVTFENRLTETEEQNILAYEYFYNGGGVAVGDFNNDNKPDLYFTGNQLPNKLYLNKIKPEKSANWQFADVTNKAGVAGRAGGWKTGVAVADVNADGWLDIYVCYSGNLPADQRKNQLFINNGGTPGQTPTFTERAEEYGIADMGYSTQATFFDYDSDGDLDLFVMNHGLRGYQRKEAAYLKTTRDPDVGDRLYRNESLHFTDISAEAGIIGNPLGYGLGVVVGDLNDDNLPDLFIGNDYVEQDYVYLNKGNRGDGPCTFREVGREVLGHMSFSTMGADMADVNNDARPDIFSVDMLPADNARQKSLAWPDNWNVNLSMRENGFHNQFMRNMLHLNLGVGISAFGYDGGALINRASVSNPKSGIPTPKFSEIGQLAGVSNTDWSWGALLADFDNDGYQDVFVSNGYVRDYTNLDFVKYYADEQVKAEQGGPKTPLLASLTQMPATATHHFAFKNNGRQDGGAVTFSDVVDNWGFAHNTVACGSAYADLDGDGDLDLVTNNTNERACLYRNQQQERQPRHFLTVQFHGPANNPTGLGAKVMAYRKDDVLYRENQPTHGFQSSMTGTLHMGLGETKTLDSVRVLWPNGNSQTLPNVEADQTITLDYQQSTSGKAISVVLSEPVYNWFANSRPLPFTHVENASIDFNRQILLPYLYSYSGPRLAEGDVNGDGRADLYVGGATGQAGALLLQRADGSFVRSNQAAFETDRDYEDKDAIFLDVDNDRDLDLLVISGAYDAQTYDPLQQDRLYLNNKGQFSRAGQGQWPDINKNGSCVVAADFDSDGDQDVFVGGSVSPGEFPNATESQYFVNDGTGRFTAGNLYKLGLVTDAVLANLNADRHPDLLVVGEYMAPTKLLFDPKKQLFSAPSPLPNTPTGFWNRALAQDLDGDGDTDFVLGNMGQNSPFKPTAERPVTLYHNDFDGNGTFDPILTYFIGDQAYPLAGRDELLEQMVPLRKKFTDYKSYSTATIETILDEAQRQSAIQLTVTETRSGMLENQGGTFVFKPLPLGAQGSPVFAITTTDLNADGRPDLILAGNQSTWRIRIGRMDASYGTVLLNQGNLNFVTIPNRQSGLWLTGEVRDLRMVNKRLVWTVN